MKQRYTSFLIGINHTESILILKIAFLVPMSLTKLHYSCYIFPLILLRTLLIRIRMITLIMWLINYCLKDLVLIRTWLFKHDYEYGSMVFCSLYCRVHRLLFL